MCGCLPGFFGTATSCTPCNSSSYNEKFNAPFCTPCPDQGTGRPGARSAIECQCSKGRSLVHNQTACGCGKWYALGDEECVNCAELNLNCSKEDSDARTVPPLDGFARLDPWLQRGHEIRTMGVMSALFPNLLRLNVEDSLTCDFRKTGPTAVSNALSQVAAAITPAELIKTVQQATWPMKPVQ